MLAMSPCNPEDTLPPTPSSPAVSPQPSSHRRFPQARRPLRLVLPADPMTASVARQRVREWLLAWCWPTDHLDDIVLAVSEAVTNAIDHAYTDQPPGMIDLSAGIEQTPDGQHRVMMIVRDHGRWRPPPSDHQNRRRGIPLMQALMDTVTIGQPPDDPAGTWVVLRSKTIPVLAAPHHKANDTPN
ncbi:MAG: ATP-binding protein [Pseudonocardiales bacterium]|nr:ATP-binding protein [Pseudonocardiales bacterium]